MARITVRLALDGRDVDYSQERCRFQSKPSIAHFMNKTYQHFTPPILLIDVMQMDIVSYLAQIAFHPNDMVSFKTNIETGC
jgi:hypothetical protein